MNPASLVGRTAPDFQLQCVGTDGQPRETCLQDFHGQWLALLFYPRDFSIVCPTELTAFSARLPEFIERNCTVLGISVDSIQRHQEWLTTPTSEGGLGPLQFPLASDPSGIVAQAYATWEPDKRVSLRGLFVIDPDSRLQYSVIHNLSVGRSIDEVIRVIDALQSGGLCPISWTRADGTIDLEEVLQPGRVIGHYRIQKQIGKGNFGTVFAARDERLDRDVAIKVLRKNAIESRGQLLEEARAAARLQHPNVCTVFAIELEDDLPLISMERIEGRCLNGLIAEGLTLEQQIPIALGIAQGLAAAHAQMITHGDLKPANVLVLDDGTPKVLDFGLARANRSTQSADLAFEKEKVESELTRVTPTSIRLPTGQFFDETTFIADPNAFLAETQDYVEKNKGVRGTPMYMSPEQIAGQRTTPASDVFSFGLILYEILTGQKALPIDSLAKLVNRLQDPDLAEELSSGVPEQYRDSLRAALSKDPGLRPTMEALSTSLV